MQRMDDPLCQSCEIPHNDADYGYCPELQVYECNKCHSRHNSECGRLGHLIDEKRGECVDCDYIEIFSPLSYTIYLQRMIPQARKEYMHVFKGDLTGQYNDGKADYRYAMEKYREIFRMISWYNSGYGWRVKKNSEERITKMISFFSGGSSS